MSCVLLLAASQAVANQKLIIDFMISSGTQRAVWVDIVNQFSKDNPDIQVSRREYSPETYGRDIEARLANEKVDIAYGFAGERLKNLLDKNLLAPFDRRFVEAKLKDKFSKASYDATVLDGRVYGIPIAYYQWGFWYKKSLFAKLDLTPPKTWSDFLHVGEVLKAAKVTPTVIATKDAMMAAAWFDYLNLRINGIAFHRKLLSGETKFSDPRVRSVFDEWKNLHDKNFFLPETADMAWENALPYLYRSKVGMVLMGGFIASKFPVNATSDISADIGFFPFPRYSMAIPIYEEAPLDLLMLPVRGENRAAAYRFLDYMVKSDALMRLNDVGRTISPRKDTGVDAGTIVESARQLLTSAEAITFFFDRDAKAHIVPPVFEALKKFLIPPYDIDEAINHIEKNTVLSEVKD